jgi:hypothetical protein
VVRSLTHKWHRPWTCRRRSEQWRIPSDGVSKTDMLEEGYKDVEFVLFQPDQGRPQ